MVSGPYKDPNQSPYDPPPAELETMDEIVKKKKKKVKKRAEKAVEAATQKSEGNPTDDEDLTVAPAVPMA